MVWRAREYSKIIADDAPPRVNIRVAGLEQNNPERRYPPCHLGELD